MDERLKETGIKGIGKEAKIARAMIESPLAGMVAISNEADQIGASSFTAPDGRLIEVERRGADYTVYPARRDAEPIEIIHDSTKPKLDVDA